MNNQAWAEKIRNNPCSICCNAPKAIQDDKSVLKIAVLADGRLLEFASPRLKNHLTIVMWTPIFKTKFGGATKPHKRFQKDGRSKRGVMICYVVFLN